MAHRAVEDQAAPLGGRGDVIGLAVVALIVLAATFVVSCLLMDVSPLVALEFIAVQVA